MFASGACPAERCSVVQPHRPRRAYHPSPQADVEGFEPIVMRSARDLLLKHSVENIIMEYSPGVGEHLQNWEKSAENPRIIAA